MNEVDFAAVYARYSRDVHRFALYLSGNVAVAEDITAETFARAWVGRDGIRLTSVKGYLLMIARNLYRDGHRKPVEVWLPDTVELRDPTPGPEAAAAGRHELRRVLNALREIPELDRAVLLMATVEGVPYEDVGAALGLSTAAVKVRVHRARLKLNAVRRGGELTS